MLITVRDGIFLLHLIVRIVREVQYLRRTFEINSLFRIF
jgi:hypothetical protein